VGVWPAVERILRQHLPLRGLTLAGAGNGLPSTIRIDALSVAFRPFGHDEVTQGGGASNNPRPMLHLYLVGGDVSGASQRRAGRRADLD